MTKCNEIWKDIEGYEGLYQISNTGRVKSFTKYKDGLIKKPMIKHGYYSTQLSKNGKVKDFRIHRLVAQAFLENTEGKPYVNHINGIKHDNFVENLEWVTSSENQKHAFGIGLQKTTKNSIKARRNTCLNFNIRKNKLVMEYDTFGNNKLFLSVKKVAEYNGLSQKKIYDRCSGKVKSPINNKMWKYVNYSDIKGFLLIIEGSDCSGKSTLIKSLSKKLNFSVVKGSDFQIAEKGIEYMYEYMMNQYRSNENLILDRSFISNLVYADMFDKNKLKNEMIMDIIEILKSKAIIIYLNEEVDVLKERLSLRGDDYIESSHIEKIVNKYTEVMRDIDRELCVLSFNSKKIKPNYYPDIILDIITN